MHFLCLCRIFSWVLIKVRTLLMFIFTVSYFFLSLRHTYNCVPSPHYKTPDSQIIQQQDQAATESHVKNTLTGLLFQALEKTKNIETKPPFQLIKNNNNMSCLLNKLQGKTISQKFESFVFFLYIYVGQKVTDSYCCCRKSSKSRISYVGESSHPLGGAGRSGGGLCISMQLHPMS